MGEHYDYESVGREAGLNVGQIAALVARWREDYPNDPPLLELRLLRTCLAIKGGHCSFDQALEREALSSPRWNPPGDRPGIPAL